MAAAAASAEAREDELVAGAQAGNAEAFEALFRRYRDRITTFVRSSVRDEGRTEDLVQEIFFSAHSSLPSLSHPAAFRTWLYQIARNACLDEARRRSRQDDLILGWDEFPPPDERIVIHNHDADRVLSQKEELTDLTQALDGLPSSQHQALVLRELEGMSYDEIGQRMQLSRHAVESVLFRARRGLKGEYSEIQTGRRCRRMQALMAEIAEGMGDLGERRKLIRHMRDCAACRREAAALGLSGLAVPSEERRGIERAFSRLAAFLPLPAFFSRRAGEAEQFSGAGSFAAQAQSAAFQLSTISGDHVASAIHKAAAVMAAVAVVGGGGVAMQKAGVPLPVTFPVFDSAPAPGQPDRGSGGGKAQEGSRPARVAPLGSPETGGAPPSAASPKVPATSSPAALTAPQATAPGAAGVPAAPAPTPSAPSTSADTPAAADSTPVDQNFVSGGSTPPPDATVTVDPPADGGATTPEPPPDPTPPPATDPAPPPPPATDQPATDPTATP
jgi:RNA polymerase sigma factor (sigma-70 family)